MKITLRFRYLDDPWVTLWNQTWPLQGTLFVEEGEEYDRVRSLTFGLMYGASPAKLARLVER